MGLCGLEPALSGLVAARVIGPLGDCSNEPALAGRTDIVLCEPWESPSWWRHGYVADARLTSPGRVEAGDVDHTAIDREGCVSGACLRVRMKQFVTTGLSIYWPLRNAGLRPEQLYMRYYLKLGPTWDNDGCRNVGGRPVYAASGGKFPGLADPRDDSEPTGQCGYGGHPADGINCWSHRTGFRGCGGGAASRRLCSTVPGAITRYYGYVYFPDQAGSTGNAALWDDDPWGQFTGPGGTCSSEPANLFCGKSNRGVLARERWYSLEQFIKMNTPGVANGVIRGWVDGRLAYEKTNMVFRKPGHRDLHVRVAWLDVYKGGVYGNCRDGEIWLDQMVLSTEAPIGPMPVSRDRSRR